MEEDCGSQRSREHAVTLSLLGMSVATPTKSHQHDRAQQWACQSGLVVPTRPHPYTKSYRQPRKARSRRGSLPQVKDTDWLSSAKWSPLKNMLTNNRLYLC